MRAAFILIFIANVALSAVWPALMPGPAAIHFARGGLADSWVPKLAGTILFLGIETVLFLLIYFSPRLCTVLSPVLVNLPNKRYWLAAEHRADIAAKLNGLMYRLGSAVFLFLFGATLLTIQANLSDPVRLNLPIFFSLLAAFLVYALVWCAAFFRSFRIPEGEAAPASQPPQADA